YFFQSRLIQNRRIYCYCCDSPDIMGDAKEQEQRTDRHKIRAMAVCLACDADAWIGQAVERPACFHGCSAANFPFGMPWAPRHWHSRDPHCDIPPKTRGCSPILARDFRGDRGGYRAHMQLYASRMDFSIQP